MILCFWRDANSMEKFMSRNRLSPQEVVDKKEALALAILSHPESLKKALEEADVSRSTYYSWKKNDPEFVKRLENLEDMQFDFVHGKFMEKIAAGDTKCILFYLETKGRKLGYSKKKEVEKTVKHGGFIAVQELDPDQWLSIAQRQQKALGSDEELNTFDMERDDE